MTRIQKLFALATVVAAVLVGSAITPLRTVFAQTLGILQAQTIGALTVTTVNGNTFTTGTYTLTGASGKTLTFNNTMTLAGGDSTSATFPNAAFTAARTDAGQTFTGINTFPGFINSQAVVQSSASLGGSPVTLTAAQCGQSFNLDVATGVVYILPSTFPAVGCTYDFYDSVSVTSNSHEIETGNASHFFNGQITQLAPAGPTMRIDQCNGTSHIAYKSNGTTTGGLLGTRLHVVVQSATVAMLEGTNVGSGALATACSASN